MSARQEWRLVFREARKVRAFALAYLQATGNHLKSITDPVPVEAYCASETPCRLTMFRLKTRLRWRREGRPWRVA